MPKRIRSKLRRTERGETVVITVSGVTPYYGTIATAKYVYADINGKTYRAVGTDGDTSVTITFPMPKKDIDVIVSYTGSQKEDSTKGYTITGDTTNSNAQLVGVMPGTKFITLNAFFVVTEGYRISKVEYQNKGSLSWLSGSSNGVRYSYNGDNVYSIRVEPETEDWGGTTTGLTADITLRVTGSTHTLHTITYTGLDSALYDASKSQLFTSCYDGDYVHMWINGIVDSKYLTGVITGASATWSNDSASFTMPDKDVTVDFTFHDYLTPNVADNDGVTGSAVYSSYSDAQSGTTPITKAKPGQKIWVAFTPKDGNTAKSIVVNGVTAPASDLYGNGHVYNYYAPFTIANTATALDISFVTVKTYSVTIASGITNGTVKASSSTVNVGDQAKVTIRIRATC